MVGIAVSAWGRSLCEERLLNLLRELTKLERARFLCRYAAAFGRRYIVEKDTRGRVRRRLRNPREKVMTEYTEFVSPVPIKHATRLLSVVTRRAGPDVTKADIALSVLNVQSFASGQILGDPTPQTFGAAGECTDEEAAEALRAILPDEDGTMKAGAATGALLKLLQFAGPFLLKILLGL